jgi:mono/diheme cytochrome c family protein
MRRSLKVELLLIKTLAMMLKLYLLPFLLIFILNGCVATPKTGIKLACLWPTADPAAHRSMVPPSTATNTVSPAVIEQGIAIYREQYCGICHQLTVAGTGGIFGPSHDNMGAVAQERILTPDYRGAATTAADYIRESIVAPRAYIVPEYQFGHHAMPDYAHLAEEQIDALVSLLLAQHSE